jgi:BlaI family transcriptional regulator, penicillinase repressor
MAKRASASKSELEIARVVWTLGEASVRDVLAAVPEDRKMDFSTVQTYLRRLHAKGYLRARRRGRVNIYSPAVRPTSVVREVVDDFVDRLFGGDALPLVQHLIHERKLSAAEIEQLQQLLDQLKESK